MNMGSSINQHHVSAMAPCFLRSNKVNERVPEFHTLVHAYRFLALASTPTA
jgi:hypothetical protein